MSDELKIFIKELCERTNYGFLFTKMYYNPKSVLGDENYPKPEEYDKIADYFTLFLNNDFTKFLDLSLDDLSFRKKLDMSLYRKLSFFLYDSIEFTEIYSDKIIEIGKTGGVIKITKPMNGYEAFALACMYKSYQEHEKLFLHNYSKEQINNYDKRYAGSVRGTINMYIGFLMERERKEDDKKFILRRIEKDNYEDEPYLARPFISSMLGFDYRTFDAVVCENRFSDIVQKLILEDKLHGYILDNVIQILQFSIGIKTFTVEDAELYENRLGKDKIKNFDVEKANNLISQLTILKHKTKVAYLKSLR